MSAEKEMSGPAKDLSPEVHVDSAVHIAHETQDRKYSPWTPSMFRLYGVLCIGTAPAQRAPYSVRSVLIKV